MEHNLLILASFISRACSLCIQMADECVEGNRPRDRRSADFGFFSHCASDRNDPKEVSVR